jgi:hypothetical protein
VTRARKPVAWARRGLLAVVLVGAAIIPGRASSLGAQHCSGLRCTAAGSLLWTRALPGSWVAEAGVAGTVTSASPAYAATGAGVAVVAAGTSVTAFAASTGLSLWRDSTAALAGVPAGSVIAGVRSFAGVVAVGVQLPAATSESTSPAGTTQTVSASPESRSSARTSGTGARAGSGSAQAGGREEMILSAATGALIRSYPAAVYGGAVAASTASTVIVGSQTVTAYSNSSGRVLWSRATGRPGQSWRTSGQYIYVTETAAGSNAVTALRRISLRTGAERVVRPQGSPFAGTLTGVAGDLALFSDGGGVSAYDAGTGQARWRVPSGVLELTDSSRGTIYLDVGATLEGVSVATGHVVTRVAASVAGSLYSVDGGVAVGLDDNALGGVWGYSLTTRKIIWTSAGLPWPHYFVDLSALGGSISPGSDILLLASCAKLGPAASAGAAPACLRPQLSAVLI